MIGIRLKVADSEASRCRDINFYRKNTDVSNLRQPWPKHNHITYKLLGWWREFLTIYIISIKLEIFFIFILTIFAYISSVGTFIETNILSERTKHKFLASQSRNLSFTESVPLRFSILYLSDLIFYQMSYMKSMVWISYV